MRNSNEKTQMNIAIQWFIVCLKKKLRKLCNSPSELKSFWTIYICFVMEIIICHLRICDWNSICCKNQNIQLRQIFASTRINKTNKKNTRQYHFRIAVFLFILTNFLIFNQDFYIHCIFYHSSYHCFDIIFFITVTFINNTIHSHFLHCYCLHSIIGIFFSYCCTEKKGY